MKQSSKANLIFAAIILALAIGLLAWRQLQPKAAATKAQLIYGDDNTVLDIPLEESKTYDVDTGYYTIHIQVQDGKARFTESPCPDHVCENYGWINIEDQQAICMPAKAVLMIVPAA